MPSSPEPFRMPIQDVFTVDRSVLIAGRVESGVICGGDVIEISGDGQSITATVARVEFLCWRGVGDPFACAGDNAALRLKQVRSDQVRIGWIATA
ncbi:hypothetical protein AB0F85_21365 [Nocardia fluminea]|uniref:hypothetical protein n=1 Tax=Nocardia fluminea TaxID=134984 RepID=UPI0033D5349A